MNESDGFDCETHYEEYLSVQQNGVGAKKGISYGFLALRHIGKVCCSKRREEVDSYTSFNLIAWG